MSKLKVDSRLIPEVNIGLLGHVSHGKCILPTDPILLNQSIAEGREFLDSAQDFEKEIFLKEEIPTFSIDENGNFKSCIAYPFFQKYKGEMIKIITSSGREVNLSPDHPLLVNSKGKIEWKAARDIKEKEEILKKRLDFRKLRHDFHPIELFPDLEFPNILNF